MDHFHEVGQKTRDAAVEAVQKLPFCELIRGAEIVRRDKDGNEVTVSEEELAELAKGEKLLGIYFSAGWCGPCRRFTPMLVSLYMAWKARGVPYEVLFVPWDHGEEGYEEYATQAEMPWPMIRFGQQNVISMLTMRYDVKGIPALFVLEGGSEGGSLHRLPTEAREDVERHGFDAVDKWQQMAEERAEGQEQAGGSLSQQTKDRSQ